MGGQLYKYMEGSDPNSINSHTTEGYVPMFHYATGYKTDYPCNKEDPSGAVIGTFDALCDGTPAAEERTQALLGVLMGNMCDAKDTELVDAVRDGSACTEGYNCLHGCLFNLDEDPNETNDLGKDPAYADIHGAMKLKLADGNTKTFIGDQNGVPPRNFCKGGGIKDTKSRSTCTIRARRTTTRRPTSPAPTRLKRCRWSRTTGLAATLPTARASCSRATTTTSSPRRTRTRSVGRTRGSRCREVCGPVCRDVHLVPAAPLPIAARGGAEPVRASVSRRGIEVPPITGSLHRALCCGAERPMQRSCPAGLWPWLWASPLLCADHVAVKATPSRLCG